MQVAEQGIFPVDSVVC